MKDARAFFPGDPPAVEWMVGLLAVGALGALLVLVVALLCRRAKLAAFSTMIMFFGALPAAYLLYVRHTGPWARLQSKLVSFEQEAQTVLGSCNQDFGCTVTHFDDKYGTTTFQFDPEYEPVRLYFRNDRTLRVAVDFGKGATAVFDSFWMLTVYSD